MEGELFVWLREIAIIIVGIFGGGATVPLVRWLKDVLGTEGKQTLVVVGVVSVVLAVAGLIAGGEIAPETFVARNLSTLILSIAVSSQVIYYDTKNSVVDTPQ